MQGLSDINMNELIYIVGFTFLGSIGALIGGLLLLSQENLAKKLSHFLASFAAGTLLGAAFFDLLPEAVHEAEGSGIDIFFWTLAGLIFFFILERFIHWFHHHDEHHHANEEGHIHKEAKATIPLVIIGDTVHNLLDGIVIAATFMTSIELGIVTTLAVIAHEIPQEMGDFGILLHKGMSRMKILLVNVISASVSIASAITTFYIGNVIEGLIPIFLAVTAGFFIYVAVSDLIPEIHYEKRKGIAQIETLLLLLGVVVIYLSVTFLHH